MIKFEVYAIFHGVRSYRPVGHGSAPAASLATVTVKFLVNVGSAHDSCERTKGKGIKVCCCKDE